MTGRNKYEGRTIDAITPILLVSALTGGLAGTVTTLFAQWVHRHWIRPILKIIFARHVDGCPAVEQLYLRLKIQNEGRTFAKNASIGLSAAAVVAADPMQDPKGDLPGAGTEDQSKPDDEPAKCPIKKTIDGKTYCFQNDPALTKPQGGD